MPPAPKVDGRKETMSSVRHRPGLLRIVAALLLAGLVLFAYRHAGGEELFFDSLQLTQEPATASVQAALRAFVHSGVRVDQTFSNLTFAVNHDWNVAHGLPPYHAESMIRLNVWLHTLNVCLLFTLMLLLGDRAGLPAGTVALAAFLASAVFAVHPLHVASISYVVQRRSVLSSGFFLAALICYLRLRGARGLAGRAAWCAALLLSFLLGIKSKTSALTIAPAILALECAIRASDAAAFRRFLKWLIPAAILIALGMLAFLWSYNLLDFRHMRLQVPGPAGLWGPGEQFLTQMRVLADFWRLILLPLPTWLSLDHPYSISHTLADGRVVLSLLLHIAILVAAVIAARRSRFATSAGILIFYISTLPWIIIPQTEQLVEYKTYLCTAGVSLILADLLTRLRFPAGRAIAPFAAGGAALVLLIATQQRCRLFRDPVALWQDVIAKSPQNFRAHVSLGDAYTRSNRLDDALKSYQQAARLQPINAFLHYLIGNAHRQAGRREDAIASYRAARQISAEDLFVYVNLADVLAQAGRYDEAIAELRTGIQRAGPATDAATRAKAHFNLANSLAARGRASEAADEYRQAIHYHPQHANAHFGLGLILVNQGRITEAIAEYETCLQLQPDHAACRQAIQAAQARKPSG